MLLFTIQEVYSSTLQGYNHRVLTSFVNCFSLCTSFCISFIRSVTLRSILIVKFTNIHQEILAVLTQTLLFSSTPGRNVILATNLTLQTPSSKSILNCTVWMFKIMSKDAIETLESLKNYFIQIYPIGKLHSDLKSLFTNYCPGC